MPNFFNAAQLWTSWLISHNPNAHMTQEKFDLVAKAALQRCASPVGRKQGFIEEPDKCDFEPEQLLCKGNETADCSTAAQVDLMKQIYQGPTNPRTHEVIFPGPAKGNESLLGEFVDGKPFSRGVGLVPVRRVSGPRLGLDNPGLGQDRQ